MTTDHKQSLDTWSSILIPIWVPMSLACYIIALKWKFCQNTNEKSGM